MSPLIEAIQSLHWGWKVAGGFLGGLATGIPIIVGLLSHPLSEVQATANDNTVRIEAVEQNTATIQADLALVRCWVRNQIEETDPSVCLVEDGRRR